MQRHSGVALLYHSVCAGTIHTPVPPTPAPTGPEGLKDVVALLVPFLQPTPQDIANNLLYYYVRYHLQLGFSKFVQYTQVPTQVTHLPTERVQHHLQLGFSKLVL